MTLHNEYFVLAFGQIRRSTMKNLYHALLLSAEPSDKLKAHVIPHCTYAINDWHVYATALLSDPHCRDVPTKSPSLGDGALQIDISVCN